MAAVTDIKVDRFVYKSLEEETLAVFLHGIRDASKKADCASLYLVMHQPSGTHSKLLTSKTRVAPLKEESVPRLELVSARILAQLASTVEQALRPQLNLEKTVLWLDSMTALLCIRNNGEWKQFVCQRVDEILKLTDGIEWKHCPGEDNPADLGTRSITPKKSQLWWNGPIWITEESVHWPKQPVLEDTEESDKEKLKKDPKVLLATKSELGIGAVMDGSRFSKLQKLLRVTAWVTRFLWNVSATKNRKQRIQGRLNVLEIQAAEKLWILDAQEHLKKQAKFSLVKKQLGLEEVDNILRCRGRLSNSDLDLETKTPIILPADHPFTHLVTECCHADVIHGGVRETLAELHRRYWVCKG